MNADYLRRYRGSLALISGLSMIGAVASMALLVALNQLAAGGLPANGAGFLLQGIGLVAAMFLASIVSQTCQARLTAALVSDLRADLSQRFLALDFERLLTLRHTVVNALVVDVSRVSQLLLVLPQVLFHSLVAILCLIYLAVISLQLLVVFGAFVAVAVGLTVVILRRSERVFMAIRSEEDALFRHFEAIADGKKELTFNPARARHFVDEVLGRAIAANRALLYNAHRWWGYTEAWTGAVVFCAIFSVIYAGHAIFGEPAATIMQFVIAALFMVSPIGFLVTMSRQLVVGISSLRHLREIGPSLTASKDVQSEPVRPASTLLPHAWTRLQLHAVSYRYPDQDGQGFQFGPVDLEIRRGEMLFVVGGNGSGKSTLALLLTGLVQPSGGQISIDGVRVDAGNRHAYQQRFSAVFADFHLFADLIGPDGAAVADVQAQEWLSTLAMQHKVKVVDGRLSTLDLSQGQRKRLALLQACIDDSEIYLFDEWAADQDPEFRAYFYDQLLPMLQRQGKTLIVITHDERYFDRADRLLKLEQGKVLMATPAPLAQRSIQHALV